MIGDDCELLYGFDFGFGVGFEELEVGCDIACGTGNGTKSGVLEPISLNGIVDRVDGCVPSEGAFDFIFDVLKFGINVDSFVILSKRNESLGREDHDDTIESILSDGDRSWHSCKL